MNSGISSTNYTISNSSGGATSKSTRYYGLPSQHQQQQQNYQSASPSNDQSRPLHKVQVLKPIINYKHNANKVIGIDMSQEEYFFYKPILGGRKQNSRDVPNGQGAAGISPPPSNENRDPQLNIHPSSSLQQQYSSKLSKKESSGAVSSNLNVGTGQTNGQSNSISKDLVSQSQIPQNGGGTKFLMHQLNSNHLMSPKSVVASSLIQNQKNLSSNYSQSPEINIQSQKRSQIQNYSSNSQPLTQRYLGDENMKNENYQNQMYRQKLTTIEDNAITDFKQISHMTPSNATARQHLLDQGRLSTGRISLSKDQYHTNQNVSHMTGSSQADLTNDPSSHVTKNSLINYENNKQYSNNPLKDISNSSVINTINYTKVSGATSKQFPSSTNSGNTTSRHSMPFQIAPSSIKFNNYLEQQPSFKQVTPSSKQHFEKQQDMPFQFSAGLNPPSTGTSKHSNSHKLQTQHSLHLANAETGYESNIQKVVSTFEEQHRFSSKMHHQISTAVISNSQLQANYNSQQSPASNNGAGTGKASGNYFEKKRLSDNVLEDSNGVRYRMEEDTMMKEIFDKKEKQRKGHNASVTTNTSTTSTNTVRKTLTQYGQFGNQNGHHQPQSSLQTSTIRKSQGNSTTITATTTNSKTSSNTHSTHHSKNPTISGTTATHSNIDSNATQTASIISQYSTNTSNATTGQSSLQASIQALKILEQHDKQLTAVMESVKRKTKPQFSLKDVAKSIKELNRNIKCTHMAANSNDNTLLFLLRQHTRTHYIALAFIRGLQDDLMSGAALNKQNENLQAIVLNALEYVKKNFSCLNDIILAQSVSQHSKNAKMNKKDINSNPFGVGGGAATTRNNSNKENYGGTNSISTKNLASQAAASSTSKSEKKMFIKQNVQISLAFLKKICRISKLYQDRFREFLLILSQIESGTHTNGVKESIKRALHQIRVEMKQQLSNNNGNNSNHNSTSSLNHNSNGTGNNHSNSPTRKSLSHTQRKKRRESITLDVDESSSSTNNNDLTSNGTGGFDLVQQNTMTTTVSQTISNFVQTSQQQQHHNQGSNSARITQDFTNTASNFHFTSQFGECKEQEHEESTDENKSSEKGNNNLSTQKMDTDPFLPGDISEEDGGQRGNGAISNSPQDKNYNRSIFGNKENTPPNIFEKPGRFSLQPQPIGGLKMNEPIQPYRPDKLTIKVEPLQIFEQSEKENQKPSHQLQQAKEQQQSANNQSRGSSQATQQQLQVQQPQLSIVTKKHAGRISNTHEPITVRGQRPNHHKFSINEDSNGIQYAIAPAYIGQRSSSQPSKEPYLPRDTTRGLEYTLVLDLDETLVHFDPKIRSYRPRPHCLKFLHEMCKYYELVVFTAGLKDYADWILNDLDRSGYITHRLYRDHTKCRHGVYIKDLSKLGRDLTKTIIVDNIEENFQSQPDNGIPIKGWYHDQSDRELERYANFLRDIAIRRVKDVRPEIKIFRQQLHHSHKYSTIEDGRSPTKYNRPGNDEMRKTIGLPNNTIDQQQSTLTITGVTTATTRLSNVEKLSKLSHWGVR